MAIKEWKTGEIIFRQGDYGNTMYEIVSGRAGVYTDYGKEDEKKLTELSAGDIFGEMALIEVVPRSATIVAEEDLTADEIDSETVSSYFREEPEKVKKILGHLSHRLRALTGDYQEVCDSIYEVDQTRGDREARSEGLMTKIKKFLHIAKEQEILPEEAEQATVPEDLTPEADDKITPVKRFQEGQLIFEAGSRDDCMYYLAVGTVGIYMNYGKPEEKELTKLTEGSYFGEMGLLQNLPRSATAVSLSNDTLVDVIHKEDLDTIIDRSPARSFMILQHISSRLRTLTNDYILACRTLAEMLEAEKEERELEAEANARMVEAIYYAKAHSMQGAMMFF